MAGIPDFRDMTPMLKEGPRMLVGKVGQLIQNSFQYTLSCGGPDVIKRLAAYCFDKFEIVFTWPTEYVYTTKDV